MEGDCALTEVERGEEGAVIIEAMFPGGGPIMGWWGPCPELGGGGVVGGVGGGEGAGDIPCKETCPSGVLERNRICFQSCVGVEVQIDKVPWEEPLDPYLVQDVVVHS